MASLSTLIWATALSALVASVPINKEEASFGFGVQNTTYDNEQSVCVVDDVLYRAGDSLASANACERCVCVPPDFLCTAVPCAMNPGCRAIHRPGHCCPDYHCECERDGRMYQNGEKVESTEDPCHVCYCRGGYVVCTPLECYRRPDCTPRLEPGACCPKYDHCPPLENVHRKWSRYPTTAPAGETDNHIHRTLLLDDDQQLDSTNTNERILRLGETAGAIPKQSNDETELPQSDEAAYSSEEHQMPTISHETDTSINQDDKSFRNSDNFNAAISEESKNVKDKIGIIDTVKNATENKVTENNTEMVPEMKLKTSDDSGHKQETLKTNDSDEVQLNYTTDPSAQVGIFQSEQGSQSVQGNSKNRDVIFLNKIESNDATDIPESTAETTEWNHKTTSSHDEINITSIFDYDTYEHFTQLATQTEGNDYFTTESAMYTEIPSPTSSSDTRDSDESATESNYSEYPTTATESHQELMTNHENEGSRTKEDIDISKTTSSTSITLTNKLISDTNEMNYDANTISKENSEVNSSFRFNLPEHHVATKTENKSLSDGNNGYIKNNAVINKVNTDDNSNITENKENVESKTIPTVITTIRVTDDDEEDGGIIDDDEEESAVDGRPPITTDRIVYTYDNSDRMKPTTIEAFAVTVDPSTAEEMNSTEVYNEIKGKIVTELVFETSTEEVNVHSEDQNSNDISGVNLYTTTTEQSSTIKIDDEIVVQDESTELTTDTQKPDLHMELYNFRNDKVPQILSVKDNNTGKEEKDTQLLTLDHSQQKENISDTNYVRNNSVLETSTSKYNLINQNSNELETIINNDTLNTKSTTPLSDEMFTETVTTDSAEKENDDIPSFNTDGIDVFVREEPPVLPFKDEMAIHQMDVVDTENEKETKEEEIHNYEKDIEQSQNTEVVTQSTMVTVNLSTDKIPFIKPNEDLPETSNKPELSELLNKGYVSGYLEDEGSAKLNEEEHKGEIASTVDYMTPEGSTEKKYNDEFIDHTTEDQSYSDPKQNYENGNTKTKNLQDRRDSSNLLIEDELSHHTEKLSTTTEQIQTETEMGITYVSATGDTQQEVVTDIGHTIKSEETTKMPYSKGVINNSTDTLKILSEVLPLRKNGSVSKQSEKNISHTEVENDVTETSELPESWLKSKNESAKEDTNPPDATESTKLNEEHVIPVSTKEGLNNDVKTTETYPSPLPTLTHAEHVNEDSLVQMNVETLPNARERNYRSGESSLDKQDILVLQEFFRKLYLHQTDDH